MLADLYFAYGSNLNRDDWREWCGEHGHSPDVLNYYSIAHLPDHDVRFSYDSATRKGGVLDIQRREGQLVPGVIFEVGRDGWKALDEKEGAPNAYEQVDVTVLDDRGREVAVKTYRVRNGRNERYVKPTEEYRDIVLAGLESYDLSAHAVKAAAVNKRARPLVDAFFVYGTLMRRELRFSALQRHGVRCTLLADAFGRLIDLGSFPALIHDDTADSKVHGDFIRVAHPKAAIRELDEIEGFHGFGVPGSLYRRTLCKVDVGEGHIRQAWTYCWAGAADAGACIASGDWREYRGERDLFLAALAGVHARGGERKIAEDIANRVPFNFSQDHNAVAESLLPLHAALATGQVSERLLAQQSGIWTALA